MPGMAWGLCPGVSSGAGELWWLSWGSLEGSAELFQDPVGLCEQRGSCVCV